MEYIKNVAIQFRAHYFSSYLFLVEGEWFTSRDDDKLNKIWESKSNENKL